MDGIFIPRTGEALARAYDRAAPHWSRMTRRLGYTRAYGRSIADLGLAAAPMPPVLDLGCGTGDMTLALLREGGWPDRIDLADPSPAMLAAATSRLRHRAPPILTIPAPLENLPTGRRYGLILCAHVLEHCGDLTGSLSRIAPLLATDGRLLLIASRPHWCTALIALRWRNRAFRPAEIRNAAKAAGLRLAAERALGPGPPGRTSRAYLITHP
jgi:ubiquinone/menaquinone biosynthesis C-methylase UbiE